MNNKWNIWINNWALNRSNKYDPEKSNCRLFLQLIRYEHKIYMYICRDNILLDEFSLVKLHILLNSESNLIHPLESEDSIRFRSGNVNPIFHRLSFSSAILSDKKMWIENTLVKCQLIKVSLGSYALTKATVRKNSSLVINAKALNDHAAARKYFKWSIGVRFVAACFSIP